MNKALIGIISGVIVAVSIIPYGVRAYQGKIKPIFTSWFLFSIIGLATLLACKQTGATHNIWPAVFGFINPLAITLILIKGNGKTLIRDLTFRDKVSIVTCISTKLGLPLLQQNIQSPELPMLLVLFVNLIAVRPTILLALKQPNDDRPLPWLLLATGFGMSIFAIDGSNHLEHILPTYMIAIPGTIALLLIYHRIKNQIPLRDWV